MHVKVVIVFFFFLNVLCIVYQMVINNHNPSEGTQSRKGSNVTQKTIM